VFSPGGDEPLDAQIGTAFVARARSATDGPGDRRRFSRHCGCEDGRGDQDVSVARGYDVTRYALNCFGSAGGQHACDVADLGIQPSSSIHFRLLLSAYGMGLADIAAQPRKVGEPFASKRSFGSPPSWIALARSEYESGRGRGQAIKGPSPRAASRVPIRRSGFRSLDSAAMRRAFERAHKTASVSRSVRRSLSSGVGWGRGRRGAAGRADSQRNRPRLQPARMTRFFSHGAWRKAKVFLREALFVGAAVDGPALIVEPHQTIVVEQGWRAEVTAKNHVVMTRVEPMARREAIGAKADPVMLEIFNHLFMSIAEQMGVTLQNTAYSVNIKERLDFSCAVFDREAASSPMRRTCRCIWARWIARSSRSSATTGASRPAMCCAQRPYNGGTHLPTSPSARRSSTNAGRRFCSGPPRAAITPTLAERRLDR
jgi:5-oxoprolinase (ATP-hydrolysing)